MLWSNKVKVITFWVSLSSVVIGVFTLFLLINMNVFGELPSISQLQNPVSVLSSEVYAEDGVMIGKFYQKDRIYIKYEDISPYILNALIATEDERFYEHSGIDVKSIMRAIFGIITFSSRGGGSTITQQLALNLLSEMDDEYSRANNIFERGFQKLKEWIIAIKLEKNFTKNEIISLYLNLVPFGESVYGVKNAARTFFQKIPKDLTLEESCVLIGMLKANTLYNPKKNPGEALLRRNVVIEQMYKNNFINYSTMQQAKNTPLVTRYLKLDEQSGIATNFREIVREDVKQILKNIRKSNGEEYNLYKDGLRVYTTLDSRMQIAAEEAVNKHIPAMQAILNAQSNIKTGSVWSNRKEVLSFLMKQSERYKNLLSVGTNEEEISKIFQTKTFMHVFDWNVFKEKDTFMSPLDSIKYLQQFLQAGFLAMNPKNGHVKVWVGGINYKYFKYDHVNINTKRQVGSSIKPLLYSLAIMDLGYNPQTLCSNIPQCFPEYDNWCSHNVDYDSSDYVPLWKGLASSLNNVSAYLIKQVTPQRFVEFLHSANIKSKLLAVPSLCLGTPEISIFEMVWAYSMFPAKGYTVKPIYITRIEDRHGNIIKSFTTEKKYVINDVDAYTMSQMMKNVVNFGTAASMRYNYGVKGELAGKTGTTNDNSDAWFIGFTPNLITATWVGCDQPFISITSNYGFGGRVAMPIFANFMNNIAKIPNLQLDTVRYFQMPANYEQRVPLNTFENNSLKKEKKNTPSVDVNSLYE